MSEIKRELYVDRLLSKRWNGKVKIITGIRRCGKSYLLSHLFKDRLLAEGVCVDHILEIALDRREHADLRDPNRLYAWVLEHLTDEAPTYLFIDEIQLSYKVRREGVDESRIAPEDRELAYVSFYDVLNDLMTRPNLDIYVTGSNSKMLSRDILTEFRGRGDEVRLHPLSFGEYFSAIGGDRTDALNRYMRFGGMPFALSCPDDAAREAYLKSLFREVYFKDIIERKKVERMDVLGFVTDFLCSGVGSLTNPTNITNSLRTNYDCGVSKNTVCTYLDYLIDAFMFSEAKRYDIKGKSYFDYPSKYYCEDVGLRNARTDFRQMEMTHIMENVIYNELKARGYSVDVGVVHSRETNRNGNSTRVAREIDFVVNKTSERVYVQSAYALQDEVKKASELKPFSLTGDSFRKIIVRNDVGLRWFDEHGILNISIQDFLTDDSVV